jgi:hypothetical protein
MNAFQGPASAVAIGKIVPKDKLAQISGMNSFSNNLVSVISPMILSRSGGNSAVLGIVNAVMGVGGIVGGIAVSFGKRKRNAVKMIYLSAIFSFQKIPLLNVCNFL